MELKQRVKQTREAFAQADATKEIRLAELKAEIDAVTARWEAQNQQLLVDWQELKSAMESAESDLREFAVGHYLGTGSKSYDKQVGVRVTTLIDYDTATAVEWAKTNAPIMVVESVDKKQFETYAKANELPFVTKTEKVSAVIASNLED